MRNYRETVKGFKLSVYFYFFFFVDVGEVQIDEMGKRYVIPIIVVPVLAVRPSLATVNNERSSHLMILVFLPCLPPKSQE